MKTGLSISAVVTGAKESLLSLVICWKYGPGSSGAVLIISAALCAAALIV